MKLAYATTKDVEELRHAVTKIILSQQAIIHTMGLMGDAMMSVLVEVAPERAEEVDKAFKAMKGKLKP